jgi:bifunctional polynucleotide phosphatase/kinase
MSWVETEHLLIFERGKPKKYDRIIAFDLDSTLIKTKSGKKFAKDGDDWVWLYDAVPKKLQSIAEKHIGLVIVSNQSGLTDNANKLTEFKKKIENVTTDIPEITVFVAPDSVFRKPSSMIFEMHISKMFNDVPVLMFVGDAAGRKGDFADSDRAFAHNIALRAKLTTPAAKISFKTPEEFFLQRPAAKFSWSHQFDAKKYLDSLKANNPTDTEITITEPLTIMILVGPPASGKSSFVEEMFSNDDLNVIHISKDIQKTKTMHTYERALKEKPNKPIKKRVIVIDNTNPSKAARAEYISKVPEGTPVICVQMLAFKDATTPFNLETKEDRDEQIQMAKHFNRVRMNEALRTGEPVKTISDIVYKVYNSKFEQPVIEEGFTEITPLLRKPKFKSDSALIDFLEL